MAFDIDAAARRLIRPDPWSDRMEIARRMLDAYEFLVALHFPSETTWGGAPSKRKIGLSDPIGAGKRLATIESMRCLSSRMPRGTDPKLVAKTVRELMLENRWIDPDPEDLFNLTKDGSLEEFQKRFREQRLNSRWPLHMLEVLYPGTSLATLREAKCNYKVDPKHRRSALGIAKDAVALYSKKCHDKVHESPTITTRMLSEYWAEFKSTSLILFIINCFYTHNKYLDAMPRDIKVFVGGLACMCNPDDWQTMFANYNRFAGTLNERGDKGVKFSLLDLGSDQKNVPVAFNAEEPEWVAQIWNKIGGSGEVD